MAIENTNKVEVSEAYAEGERAYFDAKTLNDNPYPEDTSAHEAWENGWNDAQTEEYENDLDDEDLDEEDFDHEQFEDDYDDEDEDDDYYDDDGFYFDDDDE